MTGFPDAVVERRGAQAGFAPLVVLLHGRGSSEQDFVGLADHLPQDLEYAAVRAPIAEGGGYAWFANRGIGRPVPASLAETMAWFRGWLDETARGPARRPGRFSGGAAFAGGLLLDDPGRYAGAAILLGTLPFDGGVPVDATGWSAYRSSWPRATPTRSSRASCSTARGPTSTRTPAPT